MKTFKVVFIISHPIQYMSPFFRELAKQPDIDLTVIYCSSESVKGMQDPGFGKDIKWDTDLLGGYKSKFLKNHSPFKTIFKPPFGLVNTGIFKEIRKNKYDALIVHGWHYATHWMAFIAAFISKTPVFIRSESPLNQERLKPRWKIFIKKRVLGLLFKYARGFLAIGVENRRFYEFYGVPKERIFHVPYSVDNERFINACYELKDSKDEIKKECGIPKDSTVILFSGKLSRKKRPMDLLKAYEMCKEENKALIFMGEGELRDKLELYVKEKNLNGVYFVGFKNQGEIAKYYAASDIFVLPSVSGETWGLVVNEAMCFHLPVIVSNMVGCGEDLVGHGENGYIFKTGDIEGLAKYLGRMISSEALRKSMGKRSFEIIQNYNYQVDVEGVRKALSVIQS